MRARVLTLSAVTKEMAGVEEREEADNADRLGLDGGALSQSEISKEEEEEEDEEEEAEWAVHVRLAESTATQCNFLRFAAALVLVDWAEMPSRSACDGDSKSESESETATATATLRFPVDVVSRSTAAPDLMICGEKFFDALLNKCSQLMSQLCCGPICQKTATSHNSR